MKFLAILIGVTAERLFSARRHGRTQRGAWMAVRRLLPFAALWHSAMMPPLLVLAGAGITWGLLHQIGPEPVRMGVEAAVLFLCLGPRDLADDVKSLRAARSAGRSEEVAYLSRILQMGPEPDADHRSLLGALFIQSHERLFGVLWWFLGAGPAGAVAYRLASRVPYALEDPGTPAVRSAALVHGLLAWIPVRLTALLFGLAGSMDDALSSWRRIGHEEAPNWQRRTWTVLAEVGNAALDWEDGGGPVIASSLDATLAEVLRMQTRAELILLTLAALFTAGTWIA